MGARAAGRVSIAKYMRSDYEPDAEYVDGVIERRPMGEFDHAGWQQAIVVWFQRHAEEWNVWPIQELRVQVAATRFRVPDVSVLDRRRPVGRILTHAPVAVFEVLSPEDRIQRMARKLNDYAAMGVPEIWVVDPEGPSFQRFADGELRRRAEFGAPGQVIHFPLAAIAAFLPPLPRA